MSKPQSYIMNTLDQEKIYLTTESTSVSSSMREALTNVLSQNNPVGTLTGYYDEEMSIIAVGGFFLENLHYSYDEFITATAGSLKKLIVNTPLYPFNEHEFRETHGFTELYMLAKDTSPSLLRIYKQDAVDAAGRPIWVISARVDTSGRTLELLNEFIQAGYWTIDYDLAGEVSDVCWSNEFRKMLGYHTPVDFPNELHEWYDRLHPDDYAIIMPLFHQMSHDPYRNTYDIEYRLQLADGKYEWFRTNVKVLRRADGSVSHLVGVLVNVEREKKALEHETNELIFKTLANTDSLTGLYNSRFMLSLLNEYMEVGQTFGIIYLDLNVFKQVNDTYGHSVGDKLLQAVGKRLQNCVRASDTVLRIGGDEFAILIPGKVTQELCLSLIKRIKEVISRLFTIDGQEVSIEISCGYAIYPQEEKDIDKLRMLADHRMYADKDKQYPEGTAR